MNDTKNKESDYPTPEEAIIFEKQFRRLAAKARKRISEIRNEIKKIKFSTEEDKSKMILRLSSEENILYCYNYVVVNMQLIIRKSKQKKSQTPTSNITNPK